MAPEQSLSRKSILGYALLAPSIAFAELPLYLYLPKYYHLVFGLNLWTIGAILLVIRGLDALKDPFLGLGVDALRKKKITHRHIIALSIIPFIISYYLLFQPLKAIDIVVSLSLALFFVHFFDSLITITYLSLGAAITDEYHERTRITAYREGIKVIGVILASLLPVLFFQGEVDPHKMVYSFQVTTFVLSVLMIVGGYLFYQWSPSPLIIQSIPSTSLSLREVLKGAIKDKPFRSLIFIYGVNSLASGIAATLFFFFIDHILKGTSDTFIFLLIYFVAAFLGMGVWTKLAQIRSKRLSWLVGMVLSIIVYSYAFWLKEGDLIPYGFICLLSGLCLGADVAIPPAIFADVIDHIDPWKKSHSGYFGIWNVTTKLAIAFAAAIPLTLLDYFGFSQNPKSVFGLKMLSISYALIPCYFKILATVTLYYSSIDQEKTHETA
ncbi:MAG: MFS transporter [Holosporales bacterium]